MNRSILLTVIASVTVHLALAFAYLAYQKHHTVKTDVVKHHDLNISFTAIPAPADFIEQEPEPVSEKPKTVLPVEPEPSLPAQEPEPEPVAVEKKQVISKPVLQKLKPKPKPKPQKTKPKIKKTIAKPVKTEAAVKPVAAAVEAHQPDPVVQLPASPVSSTVSDSEIEEIYITALLDKIENNKYYPRKARRRNIEGVVKVTMSISADGQITNLTLSEGHKILRRAAEKAIKNSLPFKKPPVSLLAPRKVSFSINYRFRDS